MVRQSGPSAAESVCGGIRLRRNPSAAESVCGGEFLLILPPVAHSISPAPVARVIALAASAGGLSALSQVLSALPSDLNAAILVVQHLDPGHRSWMAEILRRRVLLPVVQVQGGEKLAPGTIFLAPPDHHLLVGPEGVLALSSASRVHFVRPSADVLFGSMAEHLGGRAVAVVLSGSGSDGAEGVRAVKRHGGKVIVQDEDSAEFDGMPGAARDTGAADRVLPLGEIAGALIELTAAEARP
jgi:two-component system, chemotaxis family, protein-glutamate methylesterase/glutaminase